MNRKASKALNNTKARGEIFLFLLAVLGLLGASITTSGASATEKPDTIIGGTLLDGGGQPAIGEVKVTIDPISSLTMKKGDTFSSLDVTWTKTTDNGSFSFTAADLNANPKAANEEQQWATENGGWVNVDVVGETATGQTAYTVPLDFTSNGWAPSASTAAIQLKASEPVSEQQKSQFDTLMSADQLDDSCNTNRVNANHYQTMRIGISHRADGSTATWHYNHVSDSTVDVGISATGEMWSVSGSTHIGNSTDSTSSVNDTLAFGGEYFISKYHQQQIMRYYNGYPFHICYYLWKTVSWVGGLAPGAHLTNTLDGRCNTVPSRYRAPYGPGYMGRSQMHNVKISGAVILGLFHAGASTGYTSNIGWQDHFAHTDIVCGASGKVAPSNAAIVAVGPRA